MKLIGRRELIAGLGSAAAWPLAARAQQPQVPVIGWLDDYSPPGLRDIPPEFFQGLADAGYIEGGNVTIEYRWSEGHADRLPALAADLIRRRVAVIITWASTPAALAAKAATQTIPIVFALGIDPVESGLVASFNRPAGNITGVYGFAPAVITKRLELLHQMVPTAATIGMLVYSAAPSYVQSETRELQAAAGILGVRVLLLDAATEGDIAAALASLVEQRAGALMISSVPFFGRAHLGQIISLTGSYAIPTEFFSSSAISAGALMSYGISESEARHQLGLYTGRILKGEKPADLPVVQPTKFELAINLQTARKLGLTVPPTLLAIADRVIE